MMRGRDACAGARAFPCAPHASPPGAFPISSRQFAETFNKALQDELAVIEDRRRKLFLKREQLGEEEFFFEKYGYSYDWVFVFPILEEPEEQAFQVLDEKVMHAKKEEWRKNLHRDVDFKKYWSMKTIVENLQTAGLETKLFYSTQRDECYCKIRCPPARMEYQADLVRSLPPAAIASRQGGAALSAAAPAARLPS